MVFECLPLRFRRGGVGAAAPTSSGSGRQPQIHANSQGAPQAKSLQAELKPDQEKPRKRAWISLGFFVRFEAFQRVTSNPKQINIAEPAKAIFFGAGGPRRKSGVRAADCAHLASPSMPTSLSVPPPRRLIRNVKMAWISKNIKNKTRIFCGGDSALQARAQQTRSQGTRAGSRATDKVKTGVSPNGVNDNGRPRRQPEAFNLLQCAEGSGHESQGEGGV